MGRRRSSQELQELREQGSATVLGHQQGTRTMPAVDPLIPGRLEGWGRHTRPGNASLGLGMGVAPRREPARPGGCCHLQQGWILSPATPPAPFPRWPKQNSSCTQCWGSTSHTQGCPTFLIPLLPLVPSPHAREATDSPTNLPKIRVIHPVMENPLASSPASPPHFSSQGLSTPKVELGQPCSRGMKRKKGFLLPSEESPPHHQPQQ